MASAKLSSASIIFERAHCSYTFGKILFYGVFFVLITDRVTQCLIWKNDVFICYKNRDKTEVDTLLMKSPVRYPYLYGAQMGVAIQRPVSVYQYFDVLKSNNNGHKLSIWQAYENIPIISWSDRSRLWYTWRGYIVQWIYTGKWILIQVKQFWFYNFIIPLRTNK